MQTNYAVAPITYTDTKSFILDIHYLHRLPSISYAYGLFRDGLLCGCVTYGKPASPWLCISVAGKENSHRVFELNRLVLTDNYPNEATRLISASLKLLTPGLIIVSYADTNQRHVGIVYQASNWLYTGATAKRTDMLSSFGHPRHNDGDATKRVVRSQKHRYITFTGTRRDRKKLRQQLRYRVYKEYPKESDTVLQPVHTIKIKANKVDE